MPAIPEPFVPSLSKDERRCAENMALVVRRSIILAMAGIHGSTSSP
jgi:hypothetical protein